MSMKSIKLDEKNDILLKNSIENIFDRLKDNYILNKKSIDLSMNDFLSCENLEDYSEVLTNVMLKNKLEWTTMSSIFFYLYKKELYTLDYLLFNTLEDIYNITNNNKFYKFIIDYNDFFNVYYLCIVSIKDDNSYAIKLCCSTSNLNVLNQVFNYLKILLDGNIFFKMDRIAFEAHKNKILNDLFLKIDINENDYFVYKFDYDFSKLYENQYDDFFDEYEETLDFEDDFNVETNYYIILGVQKNATIDEIKKAYRIKAKEWHPDICKKENAEEMFKQINQAFKILRNEEKRKEYDETFF